MMMYGPCKVTAYILNMLSGLGECLAAACEGDLSDREDA